MSRLQVGGLAWITHSIKESNVGKVVKLVEFVGNESSINWGDRCDFWRISCDNFDYTHFNPKKPYPIHPAQYLMPLGDKKTQDELVKEKELENV